MLFFTFYIYINTLYSEFYGIKKIVETTGHYTTLQKHKVSRNGWWCVRQRPFAASRDAVQVAAMPHTPTFKLVQLNKNWITIKLCLITYTVPCSP